MNGARAFCLQNVARFYQNLANLYAQYSYESSQIWNYDESGAKANKNGKRAVLARKGTRAMHTIVP